MGAALVDFLAARKLGLSKKEMGTFLATEKVNGAVLLSLMEGNVFK
jgi:hypothetical protein